MIPAISTIDAARDTAMVDYKTIWQTDKTMESMGDDSQEWLRQNEADGWTLNFLDDAAAAEWVKQKFVGGDVIWTWEYMTRGVLQADFLRYLLPLVEGGVYSDADVSGP